MTQGAVRGKIVVSAIMMVMTALSGCSTIDRIAEVRDFADRAVRVNDQRIRVLGDPVLGIDEMPGTVFAAVPQSGTATFTGTAFVGIGRDDRRADVFALVGDARIAVDFSTPEDAVSGTATRFRQTRINNTSVFVPGELTFDAGTVGVQEPNNIAFDFAGSVTAGGQAFDMQGRLSGKLRGTRNDPVPGESTVRAISVSDESMVVSGPSADYSATMRIIAEN